MANIRRRLLKADVSHSGVLFSLSHSYALFLHSYSGVLFSLSRPGLLLLFILLLGGLAPTNAGAQPTKDDALVTVTVTDPAGTPLEGIVVQLDGVEDKTHHEGITDKEGHYILILPQGKSYDITCLQGEVPFKFGQKGIPVAGAPLTFALNLSIQSALNTTSTATSPASSPGNAQTLVTVVNSLDQPETDAIVHLKGLDVDATFDGRTDSNGQYSLELPRGKTFQVTCDKYGVTFELGRQTIPNVDQFFLRLKVILEYSAFAQGVAQPEPAANALVTVLIYDQYKNPESGVEITVSAADGGQTWTGTSDSIGRYIFMLPRNKAYAVKLAKYGIVVDGGQHQVPNIDSYEIKLEAAFKAAYLETYRLENVYFDTAKSTLRPESFTALDNLMQVLQSHPTMVIELAGHTDSRGDDLYNLNLSRARSNSVRDYLIFKGIDASRLAAKGYGELEPVAPNTTPEGMQLNRRTEVRIIHR